MYELGTPEPQPPSVGWTLHERMDGREGAPGSFAGGTTNESGSGDIIVCLSPSRPSGPRQLRDTQSATGSFTKSNSQADAAWCNP